jgi:hypothetical protein
MKDLTDFWNNATDFERMAVEDAYDALCVDLIESADPEFSVSLEKVVFAYDLDYDMEQALIAMFDDEEYLHHQ